MPWHCPDYGAACGGAMCPGATRHVFRDDDAGTIARHPVDSDGNVYTGITHQAIVNGGGAETWCGEWNPGDRMMLFSRDVNCPTCKSTKTRKTNP